MVALPIVLLGLVVMHIIALHEVGSNNPDGIEIKKLKDENGVPLDGIPFHPYYTIHDIVGVVVFLAVFLTIVFFFPDGGGFFLEKPNFEPANVLKTPPHIAPVWYFTPFYAILRAVPNKLLGVVSMAASIAILFVLPWLDRSPVKSIRYKGWISKVMLALFVIAFLLLGMCGIKHPDVIVEFLPFDMSYRTLGRICTVIYFAYFVLMPFWTPREKCKPVPERVRMGH